MKKTCPYSRITCDENCGRFDVRTGYCVDHTIADALTLIADLKHISMNACGRIPSEEVKTFRATEESVITKARRAKEDQYADLL